MNKYCLYRHEKDIKKYGKDILESSSFNSQDKYTQHGTTTVREHCISVANTSLILAEWLGIPYRKSSLIRGALLHDYFLYDWHLPHEDNNLHGFKHSKIALRNAERDFDLNRIEEDIIKKHMWPLNITLFPTCREGWIVNFADTYCSLLETLKLTKRERNNRLLKEFQKRKRYTRLPKSKDA